MVKSLYNKDQYFRTKLDKAVQKGIFTYLSRWRDYPLITGNKKELQLSFNYKRLSPYVKAYYLPFYIKVKKHKSPVKISSLRKI